MSGTTKSGWVPRLRFPEFRRAEVWCLGRIADIAEVLQGYGFPERYQGQTTGEYPFYKVSDISNTLLANETFIEKSANYIAADVLKELKAKPIPEGTTIFAKIGEAIRSNKRAITTTSCLIDNNTAGVKRIQGKSTDLFVYYTMEMISLIDYSGGVVPSVNKSAIENVVIMFPAIAEQQKIADCLSSLDDLITLEAQKLDSLKAHKKGLMQQLFPREGETQPHLRFPEFENAGEWSKTTLGQAATFINGRAYKQEELLEAGKYPVLRVGNFFTNNNWYYSDLELDETKYCDNGDLLYAWSASFGPRIWRGIKVIYHYHIWKVEEHSGIDRQFLFITLENETERMKAKSANGLGLLHITKGTIEGWDTSFPTLPEQHRIASCLTSLDDLITAQTQKFEGLKTHKKGLMQQLFPQVAEE